MPVESCCLVCKIKEAQLAGSYVHACAQVGIQEEGLSDVVSGLVSGSFSLGGGLGPIIGGSLAAWFSFEYAAAAFGVILLLDSAAVCAVWALSMRGARSGEGILERAASNAAHAHEQEPLVSPRARGLKLTSRHSQEPLVSPRAPGLTSRHSQDWGREKRERRDMLERLLPAETRLPE